MSDERYAELMDNETSLLTSEEITQGWHFCYEMDGLLRNNNEEGEGWKCGCMEQPKLSDALGLCEDSPVDVSDGWE